MALDREQQQVLDQIVRRGRRKRATPLELKAAVQTGLVESNLRNLNHGDRDSKGWRQERQSLYRDPTNLPASIDRFFDEVRAVRGKYGSAGDLAAAVQRPAAQYRGRYAQVGEQADRLLRQADGRVEPGRGPGRAAPRGAPSSVDSPGAQLAALLIGQQEVEQQPRQSMGLSLPAAAAGPTLPRGAQSVVSAPRRESPGAALAQALTAIGGLAEAEAPSAAREASAAPEAAPKATGGGNFAKGHSPLLELFWRGDGAVNVKNGKRVGNDFVSGHTRHVHAAAGPKTILALAKLAQDMGLNVGENPAFGGVAPVHVTNSNHYASADVGGRRVGKAIDVSGDPAKLKRYARRVASLYGIR